MSNQVKNWIKLIALLLAVLIPFGAVIGVAAFAKPVYGQTFLGELAPKYDRLNEFDEPKVIIVGGSSVAFGLDSALLEQHVGMPVVNFGLYATLGTKIMMDLSKANVNEGDIVVLAPEMDEQTLSLYFNAEAALQGMESNWNMLRYIPKEDRSDLVGGLYEYLTSKIKYLREGLLDPAGVYNRDSFNDYGDIVYERPYNTMLLGYDPTKSIDLTADLFDEEFIDYINEYTAYCEEQGATVYFSFCPMNASAVSPDNTQDTLFEFYSFLYETLDCEVISNVNDYIIDEDYFYDSNFHLNDSGVVLRTSLLAHDINRTRGITQQISIEIPEAPERPISEDVAAETDALLASHFTYAEYGSGYAVTGVTEEGKKLAALTLPASADGKAVLAIEKGAFAGCENLTKITINQNIVQLMDGAFADCPNLAKIYVIRESAEGLGVGDAVFEGAPANVKLVLTTQESYESFVADYFWSKYGGYMILEKE
ncbi:MAG: leucine-rich repeat protein [Clostridia bacterium]|nr:leucine-rich repeat protein [Clostridia bacterium]